MNESQGPSLAARRPPAHGAVLGACALAAALALAGCGQKGPLFLPAQAGAAATPASAASGARAASAAAPGASTPALAPVAP